MTEKVKYFFKKRIVYLLILLTAMTTCFFVLEKRNSADKKSRSKVSASFAKTQENNPETELYEKGYDLPIPESQREESEADCRAMMEKIRTIYVNAEKQKNTNPGIGKETAGRIQQVLAESQCPAAFSGYLFNMCNYEKMEAFLTSSLKAEKGELVTYEGYANGSIVRRKFIFDGKDMYVLGTSAAWNRNNTAVSLNTSYTRIKEWKYTPKGWFVFEYCEPEPPEVTEIINGNAMLRVKPQKAEYIEAAEKYVIPLGYQGNNLLCSDWKEEQMENIDFNGLFQYLYAVKHGAQFEPEKYADGIPKEEFESLMMEYLPVTAAQLESYAVYNAEEQTYEWVRMGCGNYAPNAFGNSIPEITDIKENEDGTVTLSIDAVCEMKGNDAVISHQLTVAFRSNGSIRYLGNKILNDGLEKIPAYQYRFYSLHIFRSASTDKAILAALLPAASLSAWIFAAKK